MIWKMMVDLTNRTTKENPFLERCIHECGGAVNMKFQIRSIPGIDMTSFSPTMGGDLIRIS
jgi:hypothetical protein